MPDLTSKSSFIYEDFQPVETSRGRAFVRVMNGEERAAWQRMVLDANKSEIEVSAVTLYCELLVRTISDEGGKRVWGDGDMPELLKMNTRLMMELYNAAYKFNQVGEEGVEQEKKGSPATVPA